MSIIRKEDEDYKEVGKIIFGHHPIPNGLEITGVVIEDEKEGGALLRDTHSGIYYMGIDGELIARPGGY